MARNERDSVKPQKEKKPQPLLIQIITIPIKFAGILLSGLIVSIIISIIIEWLGLTFWWSDNPQHAKETFFYEYNSINSDFKNMIQSYQPIAVVNVVISYIYNILYESAFTDSIVAWINNPNSSSTGIIFKKILVSTHEYISSAGYVIMTITMRAVIYVLSMPWFILCGALGVVNGLVEREIRKEEGGLEHAFIHHLLRQHIFLFIILTWVIYLSIPFSVHPSLIIIPGGLLFSYIIYLTTWTFKKYL